MGLVDERAGLVQLVGRGQRFDRAAGQVAGLVGDLVLLVQVDGGELIQDLPERAHPAQQVTDHRVGVGRVLDGAGRVREPAQRLVGFVGIAGWVGERGHSGPP